jgi:hypothetical protein
MARKLQPVAELKTRRGRRPVRLTTAIANSSERDMLVILRRKIAAAIDEAAVKATAFSALLRQFRDIDREIRAIDARAAQLAAAEDDDGDDDDAFDLSKI